MKRFFLTAFLAFLPAIGGCSPSSTSAATPQTSVPAPPLTSPPALSTIPSSTPSSAPTSGATSRQLSWSVAGVLPHDTSAFTEGLFWKDGFFYESTGMEGRSDVRRVDPASGQVVARWKQPAQYFGEGLIFFDDKFYNMTWQTKVGFTLDEKFKPLARFTYGNEGWGLTTDGKRMLQSDGTDVLTWRDADFKAVGTVKVTRNGAPVINLNELEWIRGYVWANVWETEEIVVIDPENGHVVAQLDLKGILPASARTGTEDVLNGIAYDAKTGRIFVTGKNWPRVFYIRVEDLPSKN